MPMFIAALFTIAKVWKQPKCLSIDRWTKKVVCVCVCVCVCTYTIKYYSALKKKEILPFFDNIGELGRHYACITYMWDLKKKLNSERK